MTIGSYSGQNGRTSLSIILSANSDMSDAIILKQYGENVNLTDEKLTIPAGYSYMKFQRNSVSGTSTAYMRNLIIE